MHWSFKDIAEKMDMMGAAGQCAAEAKDSKLISEGLKLREMKAAPQVEKSLEHINHLTEKLNEISQAESERNVQVAWAEAKKAEAVKESMNKLSKKMDQWHDFEQESQKELEKKLEKAQKIKEMDQNKE